MLKIKKLSREEYAGLCEQYRESWGSEYTPDKIRNSWNKIVRHTHSCKNNSLVIVHCPLKLSVKSGEVVTIVSGVKLSPDDIDKVVPTILVFNKGNTIVDSYIDENGNILVRIYNSIDHSDIDISEEGVIGTLTIKTLLSTRDGQVDSTAYYKHFKGGIYKMICIGEHTETQEQMVTYMSLKNNKIYIRPYDMFFSEVDKTKYPEVKQKNRFEICDYMGFNDSFENINRYFD